MSKEKAINKRNKLLQEIKSGISQTEIAKKTGLKRESVNRIFSGHRSPTLDSFVLICEASGYNISLTKK